MQKNCSGVFRGIRARQTFAKMKRMCPEIRQSAAKRIRLEVCRSLRDYEDGSREKRAEKETWVFMTPSGPAGDEMEGRRPLT